MATVILQNKLNRSVEQGSRAEGEALFRVLPFLPVGLASELRDFASVSGRQIEEIRLRGGRRVYLTVGAREGKKNIILESLIGAGELAPILKQMCGGSLYSYSESIIKGFVSLGGGIRVGVCGRAATESGRILGIYDVSSLNIRLPCADVPLDERVLSRIRQSLRLGEGVLVYSPPAEGKTTVLRYLGRALSYGASPLRTVIVDTREELAPHSVSSELSADVLIGYPKAQGIAIATAFMNPEVIICDEIGSEDDVSAICEAQNCGVPLIASAHGESVGALLRRPSLRSLHDVRAFGLYLGVRISRGGFDCAVHSRKEVEDILEGGRSSDPYSERNIPLITQA